MAITAQLRLGLRPTNHQAEGLPTSSLQSLEADTNIPDSEPEHCPHTSLGAWYDGRSEISHSRRDRGVEVVLGRGGSQNWDGLALALSAALVVNLGRQHSFLLPDGERETSSQWRPPPLDRRSGDQQPGSRQPGLGGALPGLLSPEAG